jgi:hypothetical protein
MDRHAGHNAGERRGGAAVTRKTCDILRFEERGSDFALVRIQADGSRSEVILTAANVVHLGLLAPDFSRRLLADKLGKRSGAIAASLKTVMANTNLRTIEVVLGILDKSGGRLDAVMTERRARLLASRLEEKADALARAAKPSG